MDIPYQIIRAKRKTLQIRIDEHGKVVVRAPMRMPRKEIEYFLQQHTAWIEKNIATQKARDARRYIPSEAEIQACKAAAAQELPALTAVWAQKMGVTCTGIKITSAAHRWGSCSGRNSICYSWRVMLLPAPLREYIAVHELCHIRQKNHSAAFYAEMAKWLPDYAARRKALRAFEDAHPMG